MQPREKFDTGVDAGRNDAARTSNGSTTDSGIRGPQKSDKGACGPPSASSPKAGLFARALACAVALALATMLAFGAGDASAAGVCSNTPETGERVECKKDSSSSDNIEIQLDGIDIDTTDGGGHGVHAEHQGDGYIDIGIDTDLAEGDRHTYSTIVTTASRNYGIYAHHLGDNSVVTSTFSATIGTQGNYAYGIYGRHEGDGLLRISSLGDEITTTGAYSHGIYGHHFSTGDIEIDVSSDIEIRNTKSYGVFSTHHGTGDIRINFTDTIKTSAYTSSGGIYAVHCGFSSTDSSGCLLPALDTLSSGDIRINVKNFKFLPLNSSAAISGYSLEALHSGDGDIHIDARNGTFTLVGRSGNGISGRSRGTGNINIYAEVVTIHTNGSSSVGIFAVAESALGPQLVEITTKEVDVTTEGTISHGIWGSNQTAGGVTLDVQGGTLTLNGRESHAVYSTVSAGNISDIDVQNATIIMGLGNNGGHGVQNDMGGIGDSNTDVRDTTIITKDDDSRGIVGRHRSTGDIDIDVRGGSIKTSGEYAYGIYGLHQGEGNVTLNMQDGNAVTTTGENGHGIVVYNFGTMDSRTMAITVGGRVDTSGAGAQGVRVGVVNADGAPERVAALDDAEGYRKQTVTVNGSVMGEAVGVFLAGGGRVVIGPQGTVGAESGIAILASGDTPVEGGDPIKPKLLVDMDLDGRRVRDVFGDDWIINDGGETTIVVNSVILHDGVRGVVPNAKAQNGAFDVSIRTDGLTVTDRSVSPWTFSQRSTTTIADRDFSAEDFTETQKPTMPPPMCPPGQVGTPPDCADPPPPMCPPGQVGTPPNCTTPPPPMCPPGQVGTPPDCTTPPSPMCPPGQVGTPPNCADPPPPMCPEGQIGTPPDCTTPPPPMCPPGQVGTPPDCTTPPPPMCPSGQVGTPPDCTTPPPEIFEEYAPRAAVYEALPGFLLKLNGGGPTGERVTSPGSPVWARLSGSRGSHSPDRSTVGQDYDFERFTAEAGMDVSLGESFTGSISLIHVRGSAEVSSPFGGGDIEAEGLGVSIGASWRIEGGYYANGNLSLTDYDVDATSGDTNVGTLKRGAFARGTLLNLEAGRRIRMSERLNLTPRAWMTRSGVSIDTFTDSVDARVSAAETARFTGGVGAVAETARAIEGGVLSLRGSLDLEQKLDDAETAVDVSGTRLESKSQKTRLLLGLGGVYRKGRFSVSGEVSMGGLGSDDTKYAGQLSFGMRF